MRGSSALGAALELTSHGERELWLTFLLAHPSCLCHNRRVVFRVRQDSLTWGQRWPDEWRRRRASRDSPLLLRLRSRDTLN